MTKPTKWLCSQRRLRSACASSKDPSFLHADSEDWSDWADAHADLSLCWVHMPFCWFCHEVAHFPLSQTQASQIRLENVGDKEMQISKNTVKILSFRTDRPGQTVQTRIRLLLIRVYTVCHSACTFRMHYSMAKPPCSNFRIITANFSGF